MKIKIDKYTIESEDYWYNVYKDTVATRKIDDTKYDTTVDVAYGVTLPRAIEIIISLNLHNKNKVVSLKEFLAEYKKETEYVKSLVK